MNNIPKKASKLFNAHAGELRDAFLALPEVARVLNDLYKRMKGAGESYLPAPHV